jgi:hypothetical protein
MMPRVIVLIRSSGWPDALHQPLSELGPLGRNLEGVKRVLHLAQLKHGKCDFPSRIGNVACHKRFYS